MQYFTEKNTGISDIRLETAEAKIDLNVQLLHRKECIRHQCSVLRVEMVSLTTLPSFGAESLKERECFIIML